jgi:hypothetical protein
MPRRESLSRVQLTNKHVSHCPGVQWKEFLTIYGGLWAAMNFLRPGEPPLTLMGGLTTLNCVHNLEGA